MNRLRWWLVSGAGIPWDLRIGARVSNTHPTGQRACRRPANFIVAGQGPENQAAVRQAAAKGLVINASTESRSEAAALQRQGIPAVCVVPPDAPAMFRHEGVRFAACPASRREKGGRKVQCISCGGRFGLPLCAQADRPFVITFPAHGPRAAAAAAHCS